MLMPRKVKHRKQQRGRLTGKAKGGSDVTFGDFGIQALEPAWITARQIEAARIAMTRHVKRGGKVWIRVFPDKPVTQKPAETRMGSGKGNPEHWVAVVKPGRILFELAGVERDAGQRGHGAGHPEAAVQGPLRGPPGHPRHAGGGGLMADRRRDLRELDDRGAGAPAGRVPGASCSTCGSSWPPASWTTRRASATSARTWPGCSPMLRDREIAVAEGATPRPGGRPPPPATRSAGQDADVGDEAAERPSRDERRGADASTRTPTTSAEDDGDADGCRRRIDPSGGRRRRRGRRGGE